MIFFIGPRFIYSKTLMFKQMISILVKSSPPLLPMVVSITLASKQALLQPIH